MPGVKIVFDQRGTLKGLEPAILGSIDRVSINNNYKKKVFLKNDHIFIGATLHPQYRAVSFEDEKYFICVDGFIHGKPGSEIERELKELSESIFEKKKAFKEDITHWLLDTDGEYIVYLYDRENKELLTFNDSLCRLPIYYSYEKGLLLVAREPRFIFELTGKRDFNRDSVFEYLLFGYPIGRKTVYSDIFRFQGGTVIKASAEDSTPEIERLQIFNFDNKKYNIGKIGEHSDNLADLLIKGTRSRVDGVDKNIIALSGGLDSRMVSACLSNLKVPFSAATFLDYFGIVSPDIKYAEIIAKTLDIDWKLFQARRATGKEVLELLRVKDGLNFLGLSFSIPLIKSIIEFYGGSINLFTGDGGDRVLRDTRPVGNINNVEDLLNFIIENNRMIPVDTVAAITGINKADFISRMKNYLLEYNEENMKMKYLQFIFSERCPCWHFQGEDRNRSYLRTSAPFYAIKFFEYCMNLPDRMKKNFRLYREVMTRISPDVAAVNNAEWDFPITSRKLGLYCAARRLYFAMPAQIRNFVQLRHKFSRKASPYKENSTVMKSFRNQIETGDCISEYLSREQIESNIGKIDKAGFEHLFTLTSLIEDVKDGKSSIEQYSGFEML